MYSSGPRWKVLDIRGGPLLVHPEGDDLSGAIERNGDFWEDNILDYIAQEYPVHSTIVDVGANIGNHTVYFGRYLKYDRILALEPDYDNYVLLVNNILENKLRHIYPLQVAISDYRGEIFLQKHTSNFGAHEVHKERTTENERPVLCYNLDWFRLEKVSLIKIDAEWHEPQVINGARKTIKHCQPLILIEDATWVYPNMMHDLGYKPIKLWDEHKTYLYVPYESGDF